MKTSQQISSIQSAIQDGSYDATDVKLCLAADAMIERGVLGDEHTAFDELNVPDRFDGRDANDVEQWR